MKNCSANIVYCLFLSAITCFTLRPVIPTNIEAMDAIRFNSKMNIEAIVVEHDKLVKLIEQNFASESALNLKMMIFDLNFEDGNSEPEQAAEDEPQGDESPIVKYINKLLIDAIRMGASDLHFEPYEKTYRVRYRVDGVIASYCRPHPYS